MAVQNLHSIRHHTNGLLLVALLILTGAYLQFALDKHLHARVSVLLNSIRQYVSGGDVQRHRAALFAVRIFALINS